MKIGITDLRRHLSELLDRVAGGEEIVVSRNEKEIARIIPIHTEDRNLPSQEELRRSISVSGRPLSLEITEERATNRN